MSGSIRNTIWLGSGRRRPLGMNGSRGAWRNTRRSSVWVSRQPLAGADEERHARPAPAVDVEAQRDVGLGGGVGAHAVDLAVAVVLAADVVLGLGVGHRREHGLLGVLLAVGVAAGRRLHRRRGDDLHQVVDDDVAQRADRVVEVAAVLDAEALGHRDLHRRDVVAVPHRLEHRVGEAQVEDLLDARSCPGSDRSGTAGTRPGTCAGRAASAARRVRGRARTASRPRRAGRPGPAWPPTARRPPSRTATAGSPGRRRGWRRRPAPRPPPRRWRRR